MTTAVNNSGTGTPPRSGPSPASGVQSQRGNMPQNLRGSGNGPPRRNVGSPANDGPQNQRYVISCSYGYMSLIYRLMICSRRGSKPWNNHQGGNGQFPNNRSGSYASNSGRKSPGGDSDSSDRHLHDRLLYLLIRAVVSSYLSFNPQEYWAH